MNKNKRKLYLMICLTLAITLMALGVTFAFFQYNREGQRYNVIKSGNLDFIFGRNYSFWFLNSTPMNVVEASKLGNIEDENVDTHYQTLTFSVKNNGTNISHYSIYLDQNNLSTGSILAGDTRLTITSDSKQFSPYLIGINLNTDTTSSSAVIPGFGGQTYTQAASDPNNNFIPTFSENAQQVEDMCNEIRDVINYRRTNSTWTTEFPWLASLPEYPEVTKEQYLFNPLVYTPYMEYYTDPAYFNSFDKTAKVNPMNLDITDFHYLTKFRSPSTGDYTIDPNERLSSDPAVDYDFDTGNRDARIPLKYPSYISLLDMERPNLDEVSFKIGEGAIGKNQVRRFTIRLWLADEYINVVPYDDLIWDDYLIQNTYPHIHEDEYEYTMSQIFHGKFPYDNVAADEWDDFYFNSEIPIKYYNNQEKSILQNQYFHLFYKFQRDIERRYSLNTTWFAWQGPGMFGNTENPNNYRNGGTDNIRMNGNGGYIELDEPIKGYASKKSFTYTEGSIQKMYANYKIRVEASL